MYRDIVGTELFHWYVTEIKTGITYVRPLLNISLLRGGGLSFLNFIYTFLRYFKQAIRGTCSFVRQVRKTKTAETSAQSFFDKQLENKLKTMVPVCIFTSCHHPELWRGNADQPVELGYLHLIQLCKFSFYIFQEKQPSRLKCVQLSRGRGSARLTTAFWRTSFNDRLDPIRIYDPLLWVLITA